jgi:hypothetical protein
MDRLTLATLTTPLIDSGERKEDGKATVTMQRKARRMNDNRDTHGQPRCHLLAVAS